MDGDPGSTATRVRAPIAPGSVSDVDIMDWRKIMPGEQISIDLHPGTIALDGEREVELLPNQKVYVMLNLDGPWVVDVPYTMMLLANL